MIHDLTVCFVLRSIHRTFLGLGVDFALVLYGKLSFHFAPRAPLVVTADGYPARSELFTQYIHVYTP
jgi:hypothetical protein